MISAFTPPGIKVVALRGSIYGLVAGETYTVRGFVICRHYRTREPDPHVLLDEVRCTKKPEFCDEIGWPRDWLEIPSLDPAALSRHLEDA